MSQLKNIVLTIRQVGIRKAFRIHGWRIIAVVTLYYLIRDLTLYVLLPYLIINHL